MWLKSVVGVGKLINSVDFYILLDLVGVGDWKVPTVYTNLYIYVGNADILHGPRAKPKMSAFPMCMYRFLYICIYSCVPVL